MHLRIFFNLKCLFLGMLLLSFTRAATAADVDVYGVLKGQNFVQNSSFVVADGASNTIFQATVLTGDSNTVTNVSLKLPVITNPNRNVPANDGGFGFQQGFTSTANVNAAYPSGDYVYTLKTVHDGTRTATLNLNGESYPTTPHFSNYAAAQTVDPTADFNLPWTAISGATSLDFLQLIVLDCQSNIVFTTPNPGVTGALTGASTTTTVPARTLHAGQTYATLLLIAHPVDVETNSYPGALGFAGYYKQLKMPLVTTGTAVSCAEGQFKLVFNFPTGSFGNGTVGLLTFPAGLSNYFGAYTISDTAYPATVTFNGPAGSGLSNTLNQDNGTSSGSSVTYVTPPIAVPAFPPGGVYKVKYQGATNNFNLLTPNASSQQTLILPTVVTNVSGALQRITWTYRNVSGATVAAPAYMKRIEIHVRSASGPLYDAGINGNFILPSTNGHTLTQTISWNNVKSIQMLFVDTPGNQYASTWNVGVTASPPPPKLGSFSLLNNGQFKFRLNGTAGQNYTILTSTNLTTWSPLITNLAPAGGFFDLIDSNAPSYSRRFYRALTGP